MARANPDHLHLPRSPQWPALRQQWLSDHPRCAACGRAKSLEVHHKVPVHVSRSMELDPANLITLCEDPNDANAQCHLTLGHLGNWYNWNRNIDKQASDALLRLYPVAGAHVAAAPKTLAMTPIIKPVTFEPANPNPAAAPTGDTVLENSPRPLSRRRRRV